MSTPHSAAAGADPSLTGAPPGENLHRAAPDRALRSGLAPLLAAAVLLVFYPVVNSPFLYWDDHLNITENPRLAPPSWKNLRACWVAPYQKLYIPLTYTFWTTEAVVSRWAHGPQAPLDPRIFHAGNLLLHLVNVLAVYGVLLVLVGDAPAAALGGLVFGLHPLAVESVAWVTETKGLLAACCALSALGVYLRATSPWAASAAGGNGPPGRAAWGVACGFALATALFVLALLAKPSAAPLPLVAWLIDVGWRRRPAGRTAWLLAVWLALAVAAALVTTRLQPPSAGRDDASSIARAWIALDALGFYLVKLAWPWQLAADYARLPATVVGRMSWTAVLGAAFLAAVAVQFRTRRLAVAGAVFAAWLLPVLGLVPFEYQHISTVADRYAYPALFAAGLAVGHLSAGRARRFSVAAALLAVVVLGGLSRDQLACWRDDERLMRATLDVTPRSFMAHNNLANALLRQARYDEALAPARTAVGLRPENAEARTTLGAVLLEQQQFDEALAQLDTAIALDAQNRLARDNRVLAFVRWGTAALGAGDAAAAEERFARALALAPGDIGALIGMAAAAESRGDLRSAAARYRQVLARWPEQPLAANNLAWLLATADDPEIRDGDEAVRWAESVCARPALRLAPALDTLAAAYAEAGRFADAVAAAEEALALARTSNQPALAAELEGRIGQYRQGRAHRAPRGGDSAPQR